MTGYNNPKVVLLPGAVGIDAAIQKLQISLADNLDWLEKSFGRAITQKRALTDRAAETVLAGSNERRREIAYPEIYTSNQEPIDVLPNDNLKSYCFFAVDDPGAPARDWMPNNQNALQYPIRIIFWMNLEMINPNKNFRFGEELKLQVLGVLNQDFNFTLSGVYEGYDQIFSGWTLTETYRQFLKPPFYGFRIDGTYLIDIKPRNCQQ